MRKTIELEYVNLDLINEWHGVLFPKFFNWVDFHFVDIHIEFDRQHGIFELEIILLGFGFRLYWVYDKKKHKKAMKKYEKTFKELGLEEE